MELAITDMDKLRGAAALLNIPHKTHQALVASTLWLVGNDVIAIGGPNISVLIHAENVIEAPPEPIGVVLGGRIAKSVKSGLINLDERQLQHPQGEIGFDTVSPEKMPDWRARLDQARSVAPLQLGEFGLTLSWLHSVLSAMSRWPAASDVTVSFLADGTAWVRSDLEGFTILSGLLTRSLTQ